MTLGPAEPFANSLWALIWSKAGCCRCGCRSQKGRANEGNESHVYTILKITQTVAFRSQLCSPHRHVHAFTRPMVPLPSILPSQQDSSLPFQVTASPAPHQARLGTDYGWVEGSYNGMQVPQGINKSPKRTEGNFDSSSQSLNQGRPQGLRE
ncbi:hypothetical protein P885DRAFT_62148 [Corynascus similis CBS 632.67]